VEQGGGRGEEGRGLIFFQVTESTSQVISSVTNILQTVKSVAEKLRVGTEDFPAEIIRSMKSTGTAAKVYVREEGGGRRGGSRGEQGRAGGCRRVQEGGRRREESNQHL
jgi:hypothetical protein